MKLIDYPQSVDMYPIGLNVIRQEIDILVACETLPVSDAVRMKASRPLHTVDMGDVNPLYPLKTCHDSSLAPDVVDIPERMQAGCYEKDVQQN